MKKQIRLTEADLNSVVKYSVKNILKEYTDREMKKIYDYRPDEEELDGFNENPANSLVGENKRKITESQLKSIIRESVMRILRESGETHRFGMGKYGLAMDAASKARSLGRREQAANLERHGADAFNQQYGTDDFEMDEYGQLRHRGSDGKERMYRPNSVVKNLEGQKGLQGGQDRYTNALQNNNFIRNSAQTAKAYPRKKMTGGLNAIDTVDAQLNTESINRIVKESVNRILRETYNGDEPYVPNKYPGQMPKFNSKQQYRQWCHDEAPDDFFDWKDDRKFQRTGIQPANGGLATRAMKDRRDGKMSWNNDKAYNRFQTIKNQKGI